MYKSVWRIYRSDPSVPVQSRDQHHFPTDEPHMWTSITIPDSNTVIYCDVTFGDPILGEGFEDNIDMKYFNISYEELMQDRIEDWAS